MILSVPGGDFGPGAPGVGVSMWTRKNTHPRCVRLDLQDLFPMYGAAFPNAGMGGLRPTRRVRLGHAAFQSGQSPGCEFVCLAAKQANLDACLGK